MHVIARWPVAIFYSFPAIPVAGRVWNAPGPGLNFAAHQSSDVRAPYLIAMETANRRAGRRSPGAWRRPVGGATPSRPVKRIYPTLSWAYTQRQRGALDCTTWLNSQVTHATVWCFNYTRLSRQQLWSTGDTSATRVCSDNSEIKSRRLQSGSVIVGRCEEDRVLGRGGVQLPPWCTPEEPWTIRAWPATRCRTTCTCPTRSRRACRVTTAWAAWASTPATRRRLRWPPWRRSATCRRPSRSVWTAPVWRVWAASAVWRPA